MTVIGKRSQLSCSVEILTGDTRFHFIKSHNIDYQSQIEKITMKCENNVHPDFLSFCTFNLQNPSILRNGGFIVGRNFLNIIN